MLELQFSAAQNLSNELKIKSKHLGTTIGLDGNGNYHHLTGLIKKSNLDLLPVLLLFFDVPNAYIISFFHSYVFFNIEAA